MNPDRYRSDNLANWNDRVPIHAGPDGYGIEAFMSDRTRLTDVVDFDRTYLGDVSGLTLAHPQCHIGADTLSSQRGYTSISSRSTVSSSGQRCR